MVDDSVNKSRLFVASCAIVKQRYPEEIANVILDDTTLPAWEDAVSEAAAVLAALQLETLFAKVREVDDKVEAAEKQTKEAERKFEELNRNIESEVRSEVNRAVRERERYLQGEIRDLEDEVMRLDEAVRNYKDGIIVKKNIEKFGPIYHKDYTYLADDDFEEDYGDEAYRIGNY